MNTDFSATGFERVLSLVSPALATRRMTGRLAFQAVSSGGMVAGANSSRMRRLNAWSRTRPGSEGSAVKSRDRMSIILEGQDLYRNNPVVSGAVDRFCDYAVCHGIPPVALSSSKEWNKQAADWFVQIYAPTCDVRDLTDLWGLQRLTLSARILGGGCGYIILKNGQIDPIEYERIQTPNSLRNDERVVNGVRTMANGKLLGFYVCNRKGGGAVDLDSWRYVRKENFIHCWKPWRFDQLLGNPDIMPMIEKILDYSETDNYILNKIKNEAMRLVKHTRKAGGGARNAGLRGLTTVGDKGEEKTYKNESWGMTAYLPEGEDLAIVEGKTPNSESIEYLEQTLRILSSCMGVPYEFLLLIFKSGSYSSHRAASLHADHKFEGETKWLEKGLMSKLWRWRIAKAIKEGSLPPAPLDENGVSEWWKMECTTPYFEALDKNKQATGDKAYVELGVDSVPHIIRQQGRNPQTVIEETGDHLAACAEKVAEHNKKYPDAPVTLDHFTNAATPGAAVATPQEKSEEDDESED